VTDYELLRAFIDQTGVAHNDSEVGCSGGRCVSFVGEERGHKVDGHGRLEVLFEADGSLRDLCLWD
jgi:hypothetical protein